MCEAKGAFGLHSEERGWGVQYHSSTLRKPPQGRFCNRKYCSCHSNWQKTTLYQMEIINLWRKILLRQHKMLWSVPDARSKELHLLFVTWDNLGQGIWWFWTAVFFFTGKVDAAVPALLYGCYFISLKELTVNPHMQMVRVLFIGIWGAMWNSLFKSGVKSLLILVVLLFVFPFLNSFLTF